MLVFSSFDLSPLFVRVISSGGDLLLLLLLFFVTQLKGDLPPRRINTVKVFFFETAVCTAHGFPLRVKRTRNIFMPLNMGDLCPRGGVLVWGRERVGGGTIKQEAAGPGRRRRRFLKEDKKIGKERGKEMGRRSLRICILLRPTPSVTSLTHRVLTERRRSFGLCRLDPSLLFCLRGAKAITPFCRDLTTVDEDRRLYYYNAQKWDRRGS